MSRPGLVAAFGIAALLPAIAMADTSADATASVGAQAVAPDRAAAPTLAGDRTAAATDVTTTTVTVAFEETTYDGLQRLIDEEARLSMSKGDFKRAWYLFWRLLEIDPDDTRALRESGRVAQALGKIEYSVDAFARVELMRGDKPDPELHFLRGEALNALERHDEAEQEWRQCERELTLAPLDHQGTMWLARIAALRKDLGKAVALYQGELPIDRQSAGYAEVALAEVEAYALSKEWSGAERQLRAFLAIQPEHARAKAILAWVLEAQGSNGEAVDLRAAFAEDWTDHPQKTVEYARALERVYRLPAALARYREARALGVPDLGADIARVDGRISPELAAGVSTRADGAGDIDGWTVGGNLPFGTRQRLVVSAISETSTGGGLRGDDTLTSGSLWFLRGDKIGNQLALGATYRNSERDSGVGGSAWLATTPQRHIQVQVRADYGLPWRESATTIREGGVVDAASAVGYVTAAKGKLLFSAGIQGRRLGLDPAMGEDTVHAVQVLGVGGADYTLWSRPGQLARGEILGEDLLAPRVLSTALVASYRHYELSADDPFGERLTLVKRSSLDEVSVSASKVVDPRGILAAEVHGGYGRDWIRDANRYRGGASLMLSVTGTSRFTFDYDVATESQTGLVGRRHAGMAVLHVDL